MVCVCMYVFIDIFEHELHWLGSLFSLHHRNLILCVHCHVCLINICFNFLGNGHFNLTFMLDARASHLTQYYSRGHPGKTENSKQLYHSPPFSAKFKDELELCLLSPPSAFMACTADSCALMNAKCAALIFFRFEKSVSLLLHLHNIHKRSVGWGEDPRCVRKRISSASSRRIRKYTISR
jgi:hypothetical protein